MRSRRRDHSLSDRLHEYYQALALLPTVREQITLAQARVACLTSLIDGDACIPSQGVARLSADPPSSHGAGDDAMMHLVQQHLQNQMGLQRELHQVQHSLALLQADEYALLAETHLLGGVLRLLPAELCQIIEGLYRDHKSAVQVSVEMHYDESTVRHHLHRALQDIKRYLGWFTPPAPSGAQAAGAVRG